MNFDAGVWQAWHPDEALRRLAGCDAAWCVAGGWALDLWLSRETRPHHDLEIAVPREQFLLVRAALAEFAILTVESGAMRALAATDTLPADSHQARVLDAARGAFRMDVFAEPGDARTWIYRRDYSISRERGAMVGTSTDGVPFLRPEGVLLYKSRDLTDKDEVDFALAAPLLDGGARAWLRSALRRINPQHRWIGALSRF